jgi:hypothetical protein
MNCLEFRRIATLEPRRLGDAAEAHILQCSSCRAFYEHALGFEQRLEKALRVSVPDGLESRVIHRAVRWPRARWYALAATIILAVGLAASLLLQPDDPLALAGIDFVVYEEAQAIATAKPPDPGMLGRMAREMRVSLPEQLGELRYVCFYPFSAGRAHHLLVTTPLGKVTLLLVPGRSIAARASASARGLEAVVVPLEGGTLAIVADSTRSLSRVEALLGISRGRGA